MRITSTVLEISPSPGVRPSVRPTVPIAEAVSKSHVEIGRLSVTLIMTAPEINRVSYIMNTDMAVRTASEGMRLPKKCALSFLLKTENADENRTATVVVFIPPAVEPGEPPISISIIKIS